MIVYIDIKIQYKFAAAENFLDEIAQKSEYGAY